MNNQVAKSIANNTTVLMGSQVITWLSSFVLLMFLPRYLGTEEYGRLYLAISVVMIFQIVIEFGGMFFIAKEIARFRERAHAIISNSIGVRTLLWSGSILTLIVLCSVSGYSPEVRTLIFILAISKLWEVSEKVLLNSFQGFEVMQYTSTCNIVEKVFLTLAGVVALVLGAKAMVIALIMAASTMLSFLLSLRFGTRVIEASAMKIAAHWNWGEIKKLLRQGLPYFLYSVFGVVYYRIDAVMLSFWTPEHVLGWYGAAYRFFDIFMFLPSIFASAIFPVMSRMWGKENSTLAETTQRSIEFMLLAGLPLSIGITVFSKQIISFFFALPAYAPSIVLLQIFAIGILLVYIDVMLGTALFAVDRQRHWSIVAFGAIFVNISLNYFLIPLFQLRLGNGGIGAAFATLLTEYFVMWCAIVLIPKHLFAQMHIAIQVKAIIAAAIMSGGLWLAHQTGFVWIVQALFGILCYGIALYALRVLNPAEQLFLKNFLNVKSLRGAFIIKKEARVL